MKAEEIFALGLGLPAPWKLLGQALDTDKKPFELRLEIGAERGASYPCPTCGVACSAHDFEEMTWRHLNFFQHDKNRNFGCSTSAFVATFAGSAVEKCIIHPDQAGKLVFSVSRSHGISDLVQHHPGTLVPDIEFLRLHGDYASLSP